VKFATSEEFINGYTMLIWQSTGFCFMHAQITIAFSGFVFNRNLQTSIFYCGIQEHHFVVA